MHEIVTLQLGQRANYQATHFWNLQESYFTYGENEESLVDHDVHFRAGLGADGVETFTPRTVIYDLKGGFGSLRKYNALYDIAEKTAPVSGLWDGSALIQQQAVVESTRYQKNLDQGLPTFQLKPDDVRYWSDFNRVFYHPRSIVQLNEFELGSQLMPFEKWSVGEELYQTLDREYDILDRDVRPFAEECDQLQGLQMFTGADDAWGGFASKFLDNLRDEFGKASIWIWASEDTHPMPRAKKILRACNTARSLISLSSQASAYIRLPTSPASLPGYVNLDARSEWCSSALLCSAMESITLPTRTRPNSSHQALMPSLEATLNTTGKQTIFELRSSVEDSQETHHDPQPEGVDTKQPRDARMDVISEIQASISTFDISYADRKTSFTDHVFGQIEVFRHGATLSSNNSWQPGFPRELEDEGTIVAKFDTATPFPLLDTFPDTLFRFDTHTSALNVNAGLSTTSRTRNDLIEIRNFAYRGFEIDERETMYNDLTEISQCYLHGWDSGSDSGDNS